MYSIDRLNILLTQRGFEPVAVGTRLHPVLDMLDDVRRVDTTGGIQSAIFQAKSVPVNSVGTRITLHENLLSPVLSKDDCNCLNCK
jgi:hypothetical protein